MKQTKVLVIGVHEDDCEYGMGGTAKLLSDYGCEILFVNTYPSKRMSTLPDVDMGAINAQNKAAAELVGAKKIIFGEDVCSKEYYAVEPKNIALVEEEIHSFKPAIVFIQWPKDNHIEHQRIAEVSLNALFAAYVAGTVVQEVYAYETGPMQTMQYFYPDFFINITNVSSSVEICLKSFNQPYADGDRLWLEKMISAQYRGHLSNAGFHYAEAFKIIKFPESGHDFLLRRLLENSFKWCGNGMYPWGWQYFINKS